MVAPVLYEEAIFDDLDLPLSKETYSYLMRGAIGVLIDLHDRGATHENFTTMVTPVVSLYSCLNKAYQLHSVRDAFLAGKITKEAIDVAIDGQERLCRTYLATVKQTLELLLQCPEDPKEVN